MARSIGLLLDVCLHITPARPVILALSHWTARAHGVVVSFLRKPMASKRLLSLGTSSEILRVRRLSCIRWRGYPGTCDVADTSASDGESRP